MSIESNSFNYLSNIELMAELSVLYDEFANNANIYDYQHEEDLLNDEIDEYENKKNNKNNEKKYNNLYKNTKKTDNNKQKKKYSFKIPGNSSCQFVAIEDKDVRDRKNRASFTGNAKFEINEEITISSPTTSHYVIYGRENGKYYEAKAQFQGINNFNINIIPDSKTYASTKEEVKRIKNKIKRIRSKTVNSPIEYQNTRIYVNNIPYEFDIYSDFEDEFLATSVVPQMNTSDIESFATKIQNHPKITQSQKETLAEILNQLKQDEPTESPGFIKKVMSNMFPKTDNAVSSFMSDTKETIMSTLHHITEGIADAQSTISNSLIKVLIIAILIVALRDHKKTLCTLLIPLIINLLAPQQVNSCLAWIKSIGQDFINLIKGYLDWRKVDLTIGVQANLASWIDLIPGIFFGKRIYEEYESGKLTAMFSNNIVNSKQGLNDLVQFFFNIIQHVMDSVGCTKLLTTYGMGIFTDDGIFNNYADRVREFDERVASGELKMARENYETLMSLLKEGRELQITVQRNKNGSLITSCINHLVRGLENLQKQFRNSGFANIGLRQEPVGILLRGAPGVFKTQAVQHMCRALCAQTLEGKDLLAFKSSPDAFVFNRQIETEYWEGYNSTKHITIIDDFGQFRETTGSTTSESMEIIRMINENPASLHMASMESKANTTFSSKFVLATTNAVTISPNTIIDKKALLRRFNYVYTVVPIKDLRLNDETEPMLMKIDKTKLPTGSEGITSSKPQQILEFLQYDLETNSYTGKVLTFNEVVREIVKGYRFRELCYKQKMFELKGTSDEWLPMDDKPVVQSQIGQESNTKLNVSLIQGDISHAKATTECSKENVFHNIHKSKATLNEENLTTFDKYSSHAIQKRDLKEAHLRQIFRNYNVEKDKTDFLFNLSDYDFFFFLEILYYGIDRVHMKYNVPINKILTDLFKYKSDTLQKQLRTIVDELEMDENNEIIMELWEDVNSENTYLTRAIFHTKTSWMRFKEKFQSGLKKMKEWINSMTIFKFAKVLAKYSLILVIITACIKLYNRFTGDKKNEFESGNGRKPSKPKTARRNFIRNVPQISLTTDVQCQDIIKKVLKSNAYELRFKRSEEMPYSRSGQGLFITNNFMLVPHHFIDFYLEVLEEGDHDALIELVPSYNESCKISTVTMFLRDFLGVTIESGKLSSPANANQTPTLLNTDLAVIEVPRVAPKANILKYFAEQAYVESLKSRLTVWLGQNAKSVELTQAAGRKRCEVVVDSKNYESFALPTTIEYNIATKVGDCGAILGIADVSNPTRKICGMHVAGNSSFGIGYSAIITYEDLVEFFEHIKRTEELKSDLGVNTSEIQCNDDKLLNSLRVVEAGAPPVTYPFKTKIVESPAYDKLLPSKMRPAKVTLPNEEISESNPWFNSYQTYNMNPIYGDFQKIKRAAHQYKDMLFSNSHIYVELRIYTYEEAIIGIPGTEYGSLNRGTSPGYPDILDPRIKTQKRKYYFGNSEEYDLSTKESEELKKDVEIIIDNAKRNIRDQHVYVDYLKDEIRDIAKVEACKTRLFSASPLRLLIAYRMYFGAYQQWFQINRIDNQSTIGLNVYSNEWHVLATRLLSKAPIGSKNIGAGDYKGFDGSENPSIHWEILDIINSFYDDGMENARIRKVLWYELVNSLHYFNGRIIEWTSSLPSGHPMTAIVNNMYNGIAFRFCWYDIFKNTPFEDKFEDKVYLATMGDDNVFSVSLDAMDKFNESTIANSMKLLGLHYTKEDKTTPDATLRDVTEVEFLKRKWRYDQSLKRYVAPLRLNRLLETINWTKKGPYTIDIPRDNVDTILMELSLHEKSIFDHWSYELVKVSREYLDYYPPVTQRSALLRKCAEMQLNY